MSMVEQHISTFADSYRRHILGVSDERTWGELPEDERGHWKQRTRKHIQTYQQASPAQRKKMNAAARKRTLETNEVRYRMVKRAVGKSQSND